MQFERFGKYLLLEKLASGGMAEVYLAKTTGLSNFVAIKRILPQFSENTDFIQMFKEEAKIAASLRHSNIVSIHFFGQEKRQLFLVMDFVEGQNLRQILNILKKESKYLSLDQIVYLIKEVASGLDYAHRALDNETGKPLNIIHRDMSPQNVMISFEGEVKIVDFGIAKAENQMEQTQAGTIKGKFGYMSPEQAEGLELDARTDVFSLGVILWELLSKERLFVGSSEAATLKKVRDCQIPNLRKIDPNIPIELERITMKALSKNLDMRYVNAMALHKDLNRFLNLQYPEFSKSDFSRFMKGLFHTMFIENRKKLVDYSRLSSSDAEEDSEKEATKTATVTATVTAHDNEKREDEHIPGLDPQKNTPPSKKASTENEGESEAKKISSEVEMSTLSEKIDLKQLKVDSQTGVTRTGFPQTPTRSQVTLNPQKFESKPYGNSQPFSYDASYPSHSIPSFEKKSSFSGSFLLILLICGGLGLWYHFDDQFKKVVHLKLFKQDLSRGSDKKSIAEQTSLEKTDQASTATQNKEGSQNQGNNTASAEQMVPLHVQSNPSGSFIEVQGESVGITPYRGSIPKGLPSKITIKKEGFVTFEKVEHPQNSNPIRIEATLQPEPPKGYIVIEMIGAPLDTVIEVNNRRIEDKSQLSLYAVPAGIPIQIKAHSPFSGISTATSLTVEVNQKRHIKLVMAKDQPKK
jgi:eukaryotic-like serine/threonine-protein kinase